MDAAALIKKHGGAVLGGIGVALWLVALYLLASAAQNSAQFDRWLPWILLINISGLLTLLVLLAAKLYQLVKDFRRNVPGSRLKGRTVAIFSALAVAPILVVYYFALQFLNRGIDSWFEIEVSQGLKDTRELSHAALEVRVREFLAHTELVAHELSGLPDFSLVATLDRERRDSAALEFTVVGAQMQIIATSSERPMDMLPVPATDEMMLQVRRSRTYISLDTDSTGGYVIRAAAQLDPNPSGTSRVLIALYPVPQQLSQLADTVQRSYTQYANLVQMRRPLKSTFVLILTFVVLMSLIAAVYGAFFAAQRLVQPVQDLIAGTRAVAKGNYDTQLPLPSRDELGFLVTSFNDMTKRLGRAREETRRSREAVEAERAGLAVILARLSTGVVSLAPDLTVRTANQAASAILGVDLEAAVGTRFDASINDGELFGQFLAAVKLRLDAGQLDWREQLELPSDAGRRVLMCACTELPTDGGGASGGVLVFDDITTLLQAQRDAAWGEVARRLAHEIKNPLTPISLSAEQIHRHIDRLGATLVSAQLESPSISVIRRSSEVISSSVESMRSLVDQFSALTQFPTAHPRPADLNPIVENSLTLFAGRLQNIRLIQHLAPDLPLVLADPEATKRALGNLIDNAAEAMQHSLLRELRIATALLPSGMVELTVSDTAPALPTRCANASSCPTSPPSSAAPASASPSPPRSSRSSREPSAPKRTTPPAQSLLSSCVPPAASPPNHLQIPQPQPQ